MVEPETSDKGKAYRAGGVMDRNERTEELRKSQPSRPGTVVEGKVGGKFCEGDEGGEHM